MIKKILKHIWQFKDIISLAKTRTAKETGLVLTGNIIGAILGFIISITLVRVLGPADFGLLSAAIAIMSIASQFTDLGINTGLVKFASEYLKCDQDKSKIVLKIAWEIKLMIGLVVLIVGILLSETLAVYILHKPELTSLLKLAFIGSYGLTLLSFIQANLQAYQWFKKLTIYNISINFFKLILFFLLLFFNLLNLKNALLVNIVVPIFAFILGSFLIPKDFLQAHKYKRENFWRLIHFSKWITISSLAVMIIGQLDILMLTSLKSAVEVGYYATAQKLAFLFPLITGALTTTLLPKVSLLQGRESIVVYIKKILKITPWVFLIFIPLIILAKPLIILFFGPDLQSAVLIFQILLTGFIFGIVLNPISLVLYNLNKAYLLAYLNIGQLIVNFLVDLMLIPILGGVGAALATFLVQLLGCIFISLFLNYYLNNKDYAEQK